MFFSRFVSAMTALSCLLIANALGASSASNGMVISIRQGAAPYDSDGSTWVTVGLKNPTSTDLYIIYFPAMDRLRFEIYDATGHKIGNRTDPITYERGQTGTAFPAGYGVAIPAKITNFANISKAGTYCVRARYRVFDITLHKEIELVSDQIQIFIR